jgi:hypothetical protein
MAGSTSGGDCLHLLPSMQKAVLLPLCVKVMHCVPLRVFHFADSVFIQTAFFFSGAMMTFPTKTPWTFTHS